jgi:hypothetical protein
VRENVLISHSSAQGASFHPYHKPRIEVPQQQQQQQQQQQKSQNKISTFLDSTHTFPIDSSSSKSKRSSSDSTKANQVFLFILSESLEQRSASFVDWLFISLCYSFLSAFIL